MSAGLNYTDGSYGVIGRAGETARHHVPEEWIAGVWPVMSAAPQGGSVRTSRRLDMRSGMRRVVWSAVSASHADRIR